MISLYKHQEEGRDFLLSHKKACLFFGIGAGKTYTALAALITLPPGRVLIAAPLRVLKRIWIADKEFDISKHDVTYLNYEKIARDSLFTKQQYDYIILDEVHKLKGKTSNTSKRCQVICTKAKYVFGLTGTPVANHYDDIFNIYKHMTIPEFGNAYDPFIDRFFFTYDIRISAVMLIRKPTAVKPFMMAELMERIGKHALIKRTEDCVDLPEKTLNVVHITGMRTEKYDEFERNIFISGNVKDTMIRLESINKMRQAANNSYYDKEHVSIIINKINHKFETLQDLLSITLEETEKVIVVYYFEFDLTLLKTIEQTWTLDDTEFETNDEIQVLFRQWKASEGLNWQFCTHMIFYSYDYSFVCFDQMCGRIYRNGQLNKVTFTVLISENTIENKVWWAIKNKKTLDEYLKEVLHG